MISLDTSILLYGFVSSSPLHSAALAFISSIAAREDITLSEFILTEFYLHLRNPAVLQLALSAPEAARVIASYRQHPKWKIVGFTPRSRELHDELWRQAASPSFARRRIFDAKAALNLRAFGVTEFATANVKDFQGFGFSRVWNPLVPA